MSTTTLVAIRPFEVQADGETNPLVVGSPLILFFDLSSLRGGVADVSVSMAATSASLVLPQAELYVSTEDNPVSILAAPFEVAETVELVSTVAAVYTAPDDPLDSANSGVSARMTFPSVKIPSGRSFALVALQTAARRVSFDTLQGTLTARFA